MRIRLPFRRRVKLEPVKALPVNEDEFVPVVVDYEVENYLQYKGKKFSYIKV